jgi:hypothetical protein
MIQDTGPTDKWFEIRNAPKPVGDVIAIWHQTRTEHELAFGVRDAEYVANDENSKAVRGDDVDVIADTLVFEITSCDYDLLVEIADIPKIISDGKLHFLGVLKWCHSSMGFDDKVDSTTCAGNVYTKVVPARWCRESVITP